MTSLPFKTFGHELSQVSPAPKGDIAATTSEPLAQRAILTQRATVNGRELRDVQGDGFLRSDSTSSPSANLRATSSSPLSSVPPLSSSNPPANLESSPVGCPPPQSSPPPLSAVLISSFPPPLTPSNPSLESCPKFRAGDRISDLLTTLRPLPRGYRPTSIVPAVQGLLPAQVHPEADSLPIEAALVYDPSKKPKAHNRKISTDLLSQLKILTGDHVELVSDPGLIDRHLEDANHLINFDAPLGENLCRHLNVSRMTAAVDVTAEYSQTESLQKTIGVTLQDFLLTDFPGPYHKPQTVPLHGGTPIFGTLESPSNANSPDCGFGWHHPLELRHKGIYLLAAEDKASKEAIEELLLLAKESHVISARGLQGGGDYQPTTYSWIRQLLGIQMTRNPFLIFARSYEAMVVLRIEPPGPDRPFSRVRVSRRFESTTKVTRGMKGPHVAPTDAGMFFVHWACCIGRGGAGDRAGHQSPWWMTMHAWPSSESVGLWCPEALYSGLHDVDSIYDSKSEKSVSGIPSSASYVDNVEGEIVEGESDGDDDEQQVLEGAENGGRGGQHQEVDLWVAAQGPPDKEQAAEGAAAASAALEPQIRSSARKRPREFDSKVWVYVGKRRKP